MDTVNCKDCGLMVSNEFGSHCYKTNEPVDILENKTCSNFIAIEYDGDSPFTPSEHNYLLESLQKKKMMTNKQGLRF